MTRRMKLLNVLMRAKKVAKSVSRSGAYSLLKGGKAHVACTVTPSRLLPPSALRIAGRKKCADECLRTSDAISMELGAFEHTLTK